MTSSDAATVLKHYKTPKEQADVIGRILLDEFRFKCAARDPKAEADVDKIAKEVDAWYRKVLKKGNIELSEHAWLRTYEKIKNIFIQPLNK